jgi:hypothetical protein
LCESVDYSKYRFSKTGNITRPDGKKIGNIYELYYSDGVKMIENPFIENDKVFY